MNEYMVEIDAMDSCGTAYYETNNYKQLIEWIESDLKDLGGGHADIYNEDGEFVDEIEI